MTILTEKLHAGGFLVSEEEGFYSRDAVTITNTTALAAGTIISKIGVPASETAVAAAVAGNVGTGALTMDGTAPIGAGAIDGVYELVLRQTSATASFELMDPNGVIVGEGNVATLFNGVLKFTLANAGTMTIGDRWTITVNRAVPGADLWGALDVTQTNGQQLAAGVLFQGFDVGSGTQLVVAVVRNAEIRISDLAWPSGFTATQIAKGLAQLRAIGIVGR